MGITNSFFSIQFVRIVEPDYLGRAAAVFNSAGACIDPLMSVLVAGLAALLSIQVLFAIAAAAAAVIFVILARLKICCRLNREEKPAIMEGEQSLGAD